MDFQLGSTSSASDLRLLANDLETEDYILVDDFVTATKNISVILDELYASIPDNKRISYGTVYTIKITAKYIFENFSENRDDSFSFTKQIFDTVEDYRVRGVALGVISFSCITREPPLKGVLMRFISSKFDL